MLDGLTIYKYRIPLMDSFSIRLPVARKLLKVGEYNRELALWAMIVENSAHEDVQVYVIGTGSSIAATELRIRGRALNPDEYFDTIQMRDGLVWHVFIAGPRNTLPDPLKDTGPNADRP